MERSRSFENLQPRDRSSRRDATWFLHTDRSQSAPPEHHFEAYNTSRALNNECHQIISRFEQFEQEVSDRVQNRGLLSQEQLETYRDLVSDRKAYDNHATAFYNAGYANSLNDKWQNDLHLGASRLVTIREQLEPQVARLAYESLRRERADIIRDYNQLAGGLANHTQQDIQQSRPPTEALLNSFMEMATRSSTYTDHVEVFNQSEHLPHLTMDEVNLMANEARSIGQQSALIADVGRLLVDYYRGNMEEENTNPSKKRKLNDL